MIRQFHWLANEAGIPVRSQKIGLFNELAPFKPDGPLRGQFYRLEDIVKRFGNYTRSITNKKGVTLRKKARCLFVGGFVRDILLGRAPKDVDLVTDLSAEEIRELLKDLPGVHRILVHGKSSKIVRLVFEDGSEYEISTFKGEGASPRHDANMRDFTFNALFYNPITGYVIDFIGGLEDIQKQVIRFTGNAKDRINEDPVRMLRALRFIFETDFSLYQEEEQTVKELASTIKNCPIERIKSELDRILASVRVDEFLRELDRFGLLEQLLPDISRLKECQQGPPYHLEGNVFDHLLLVGENLPQDCSIRLKWATIFHDIAKPDTRQEIVKDSETKVSFIGHEEQGSEKAEPVLKMLNFSNQDISDIKWLIGNHHFFLQRVYSRIVSTNENKVQRAWNRAKNSVLKLMMEKGIDLVEELYFLSVADVKGRISINDDTSRMVEIMTKTFEEARDAFLNQQSAKVDFKKVVSGKLIMEILQIKPGPEIGRIQKAVIEKLVDSGVNFETEEEALSRAKEILGSMKKTMEK